VLLNVDVSKQTAVAGEEFLEFLDEILLSLLHKYDKYAVYGRTSRR
jgi:hypothetical protein